MLNEILYKHGHKSRKVNTCAISNKITPAILNIKHI